MTKFEFSSNEFAAFAQTDLAHIKDQDAEVLAHSHGDHKLNPDLAEQFKSIKLRDAAVLIPVMDHEDGARVILTKRTEKLRKHSGQVAFAGGSIDEDDGSAEIAAMREAEEEIGLSREFVTPVGRLPLYKTLTGFSITPILATLRPGYSLQANPDEVSEIFDVSLAHLMNTDNHVRDSLIWQDKERFYYTVSHSTHRIWGVTAGIIRTLYERLYT